jgi:alpha-amylase/alpha-mannosidase (GH57 family)
VDRYVCIHGHFYQPPRENPWLEAIQQQDSAYPYHDWNERIAAECYAPNATSRILDAEDRIVSIVNNYCRISFNFGPTLLSWIEQKAPDVYRAVLAADTASRERCSGHGSALAQPYNHMILPLATLRDKVTQVRWGLRDFERRFGRKAEGMWLPETAVDLETLTVLADHGIRFTLLAPSQARRVRKIGARGWRDVGDGRIDPTMAYQVRLPRGRSIAVFFYDDPISRAVAFEGLLSKGEHFAGRLAGAFTETRAWPQLVHVATDGETYGHHHRFGDMALAYALHHIETNGLARLTNYGEYLERHPPTHLVEVQERTAWSCVHGLGRWMEDCGCSSGGHPGWSQSWRGPLRTALDWLRDALAPRYEERARELLRDPWAARDEYVDVVLDRTPAGVDGFLDRHAARPLSEEDRTAALRLLELQRQTLLMYTSCGWFFDDVSGIETVQVLQYAGCAVQLAELLFGEGIEAELLSRLAAARGNRPEQADGARVYERQVQPAMVNLRAVAAHYAISSLFDGDGDRGSVYCYDVDREDYRTLRTGRTRLALGRARVTSRITRATERLDFGVLYYGDHTVSGGVREARGAEAFEAVAAEASAAFERADYLEVVRVMDRQYGDARYSLKSLFRDERRRILGEILDSALEEAAALYRQVYEKQAPLMRFLGEVGVPLPRAFETTAEFVINASLRRILAAEKPDLDEARTLLETARRERVPLDRAGLGYVAQKTLERSMEAFRADAADLALLRELEALVRLIRSSPFEVSLWTVQNRYYEMLQAAYPERLRGEGEGGGWVRSFAALGEALGVRVPGSGG